MLLLININFEQIIQIKRSQRTTVDRKPSKAGISRQIAEFFIKQ
ncbi:MAG: hypothetical protein RMX35_27205 [Nostoc sp. DcaGUA01]|nr:hypothetical protein [Nostoc sp. DcaGUA01]